MLSMTVQKAQKQVKYFFRATPMGMETTRKAL